MDFGLGQYRGSHQSSQILAVTIRCQKRQQTSTQPSQQSHSMHIFAALVAMQQKREASMAAVCKRTQGTLLRLLKGKIMHRQAQMEDSSSRTQLLKAVLRKQAPSLWARSEISSQSTSQPVAASCPACSQTSRLPSQPFRSRACRKACRQQQRCMTARRLTWRSLSWHLSWCPRRLCRQGLSPAAAQGCMRLKCKPGQCWLLLQSLRPSPPPRCALVDPVTLLYGDVISDD